MNDMLVILSTRSLDTQLGQGSVELTIISPTAQRSIESLSLCDEVDHCNSLLEFFTRVVTQPIWELLELPLGDFIELRELS